MKILLIDDDGITLDLLEFNLKEEGHEVCKTESPYQALDLLNKENFDIILSDVFMPGMSGLSLLSLIKNIYLNKKPFFLISSCTDQEIIDTGINLKAEDFFIKPINIQELITKINQFSPSVT